MLNAALSLKEAFFHLERMDKSYKHNTAEEEWNIGRLSCDCLEVSHDATRQFSGIHFPTANDFFPDICTIQLFFSEWEESKHDFYALRLAI